MHKYLSIGAALCVLTAPASAANWTLSVYGGGVYNKKEDVRIEQYQHDDILLPDVQFKTKPFKRPIYYGIRLSRWRHQKAWEISYIHQKLHLDDPPDPIRKFEITHGYNLFYVSHARRLYRALVLRLGVGSVLTNPDVNIGGQSSSEAENKDLPKLLRGYYWRGYTVQIGLAYKFFLSKNWVLNPQLKLTYAHTPNVPIPNGQVDITNTALHLCLGMEYDL